MRLLCLAVGLGSVDLEVDVERLPVQKDVADAGNNFLVFDEERVAGCSGRAKSRSRRSMTYAGRVLIRCDQPAAQDDGTQLERFAVELRDDQALLETAQLS